MPPMMNNAAFRAYAIACSILVFKMFAAAILTASTRTRVKQFLNPEDAGMAGGTGVMHEHPDVQRMLRLHRNDLENILPFFTAPLIFVLIFSRPAGRCRIAGFSHTFRTASGSHPSPLPKH